MKRIIIGLILLLVIAATALAIWIVGGSSQPLITEDLVNNNQVVVDSPPAGASIISPVVISGQARGQWFFEASFPVKIVDASGQVLGQAPAQARNNWMTEELVPFQATISFSQPATSSGFIVLAKDNPSGLPEHDAEVRIPIQFSNATDLAVGAERTVKFYYYDAAKDKDEQGNIRCSQQGLVAINRQLPVSISPIKDTLQAFLNNPLSEADKAAGLTSEFPLAGVSLVDLALRDGNLIVQLADPNNKTSGGSCRVAILRQQLEAVVRQFPEVKTVVFQPEELFQP